MGTAIDKQSYPILYSLCEWGQADVTSWGPSVGSSFRISGDVGRKFHFLYTAMHHQRDVEI